MKNYSHSPVTEMLSGRHKIWLMVGLALMSVADLSACIALWVFGAASSYWTLPFLMVVIDLLYLAGVALSNQRFKYARTLFFAYIVITIVFVITWLAEFASNPVVLSNTVEAAWGLSHVVGIMAVAISYLYASRRLRLMRHVQFALAIIFSAVALLALVVVYGVTVISDGYFGQGNDTLPLVYNYIGDDECEVLDIVYGKGSKVVIPYEFNGRKVTGVSAKVFTYANVKSVTLNCDSDVELCEDISSSLNTNITIYADKKDVDTIKQKLYSRNSIDNYYRYQFELGNNVRPIGLDKDEVYVTFDYDRNAYSTAHAEIIPTWYGKKGDTFKLSDIKGVEYAEHSDVDSDYDLFYCYNNVGGYIMSELKDGGEAIDGAAINKSRNSIEVRFQKVFKIFAGASNDTMYDTAKHMQFSTINGVTQNYKLTVAQNAESILEQFDRGEAFTRTVKYSYGGGSYQEFGEVADVLKMGYSDITVAPYWKLVTPQITLSSLTAAEDIVYGDDFELTASVTHPLADMQIDYEWWYDVEGQCVGYEQILQRKNVKTVGEIKFRAIAKVSAPQTTSLTTANAAEIKVTVNKRPLTVTWEHKSYESFGVDAQIYGKESVFDGKERVVLPTAHNVAQDDYINLMGYAVMNAGTFTDRATLSSALAEKYYIAEGETYTYTIHPCPVPLTWEEQTEFVYDGNRHTPTAHALDLSGEELTIYYFNSYIDAGNYTATAGILDSNYTVDEASEKNKEFKITPKQVDVEWGNTALTYNKSIQVPTASATGVNGISVHLIVTGGQINANLIGGEKVKTYYGVAETDDGNYTLNPDTASQEFTISPYSISFTWTYTTTTYDGKWKSPIAYATDVDGRPMTVYMRNERDAGEYTNQVTLNDNYVIVSGASILFTIKPMEVRVEWSNTSLTYNGNEQKPTATANGVDGVDLPLVVTGSVKIGSGIAKAEFTAEQNNYTLTNATRVFAVERKTLTVTVQDATFVYGQSVEIDLDVQGVVNGDDVTAIPTAKYTPDDDGNVPVGEYEIIVQLDGEDKNCYKVDVVRQGKVTVTAPTQTTEG